MPDNEPIRQQIRTDYDGKPVEDAARDIKALAEENEKAGKQAEETARDTKALGDATEKAGQQVEESARKVRNREQRLADMKRELNELSRVEDRYQRNVKETETADERATVASQQRRARIERLSNALAIHQRGQDAANESVRRAAADQAAAGEAAGGHAVQLGALTSSLKSMLPALGALAALRGAYALVRGELQQIIDLQNKAFQSQVTLASAQRSLRLNLAGQSSETVDQAFEIAAGISSNRGVGEAQVMLALAQAVSSTGGDLGRAAALTDLAAQIRPDQPGELGGIAGALGDVGNAIGSRDPREALGFFLKVAGLARVAESERQFKNIPVAIKGLVGEGFSATDAGALFAAQTLGTGDITGEQSGTAVISFASQINEFFKEQGRSERGSAALQALRGDPALAKAFTEVLSVERKAAAPLRELLSGGETARNFDSFRGQFGSSRQLIGIGEAQLAELSRGEIEKTAEVARRLDATEESLLNLDTAGGRAAAIRSGLIGVLNASGESNLAEQLNNLQFNVGGAVNQEHVARAITLIRDRRNQLLSPQRVLGFAADEFGGTGVSLPQEPTQLDRQRAAQLESLIGELESIGDVRNPGAGAGGASGGNTIINNYGTTIHQGRDPYTSDLGRPRE
jgi:hypothetical protein